MGKQRCSRKKRRRFHGNQNVTEPPKKDRTGVANNTATVCENKYEIPTDIDIPSGSRQETTPAEVIRSRKIKLSEIDEENIDKDDYFIYINFSVLQKLFMEVGLCPACREQINISDDLPSRMGLAHKIIINCECGWRRETFTSNACSNLENKQGRKPFEINIRTVLAYREIGRGHESIKNVSRLMNMYSIGHPCYNSINKALSHGYEMAAESSMKEAGREVTNLGEVYGNDDNVNNTCRISVDGSWQKRGHNSLHGVVTAISNGKCIDFHVMSKHCKQCRIWESRKGTNEYITWKEIHNCNINHTMSSGSMEAVGAVEMYRRSISKHNLIYNQYLGDGDTSSFKEVVASNPYKEYDVNIIKLECVGHVQKRLGTQLRNKVKEYKGTKSPISGKGKLTEKIINSMQNFYGLAIRQNCESLYLMKKAVGAILWHCTKFDHEDDERDEIEIEEYRHRFCPPGSASWCKFKKLEQSDSDKFGYNNSINIPEYIHDIIKPIFVKLSSDELLCKCLHGQTQNGNEALNNIIWKKCPKAIFVERPLLEMSVNSAILEYNEGSTGVFKVFNIFKISPGICSLRLSRKRDTISVGGMVRKSSEKGKKRRKAIRKVKKGIVDNEKDNEKSESYVAGGF